MALTGQQPLIVGVSVALVILATASDALRFFSRWMMRSVCMPAIKVTMVLFYWRLFSGDRRIRIALYTIGSMLFAWFVGALASGLVVCEPLPKFWDHSIPGKCLHTMTYFRAIAGTNLATDVFLLVLPIPIVWGLHRPASERLALIAVFTLGALSIPSLLGLTSYLSLHCLGANTQGTIWTSVETSVGVVCVNLPTMSPLFRRYILGREVSSANSKPRSLPLSYPPSSKKPTANPRRHGSTSSTEGLETKWSISDNYDPDIVVTTDLTVTEHDEECVEMDELKRQSSKVVCHGCADERDPKSQT
ncbi:hypothetical protein N7490_002331 [Penicillium lividum]|nr:hypothetical protein N7490_002331 [Penicillium lividum]